MPGEFVSDGKSWKPAKREIRGPSPDGNGVLKGDLILRNADGSPQLVPDPAAMEYIAQTEGKGKTEIPVVPWKDARTPNVVIVQGNAEVVK